jgi:hypothetical protein
MCYYISYWSGIPLDGLEVLRNWRRLILAHPTNNGLVAVFTGYPIEEFHKVRADIEGSFWAAAALWPSLMERLRSGVREERRGWALVGDAGHHKDFFAGPNLVLHIHPDVTTDNITDLLRDGRAALPDGDEEGVPVLNVVEVQPLSEKALAQVRVCLDDAFPWNGYRLV